MAQFRADRKLPSKIFSIVKLVQAAGTYIDSVCTAVTQFGLESL